MFHFFPGSSTTNCDNDELIAIELELTEIKKQMNRLHHQRTSLIKRQKQLKETIKGSQQLTTRLNDRWERTGSQNKRENLFHYLFIFLF